MTDPELAQRKAEIAAAKKEAREKDPMYTAKQWQTGIAREICHVQKAIQEPQSEDTTPLPDNLKKEYMSIFTEAAADLNQVKDRAQEAITAGHADMALATVIQERFSLERDREREGARETEREKQRERQRET